MKRRYPLEPVRSLKKHAVDDRAQRLAAQVRRTEQAARTESAARGARERHEADFAEISRAEHELLEQGELNAADLERQALWARAEAERSAALRRSELAAAEKLKGERKAEVGARAALARADADAEAVERHRERWQKERERVSERVDEDEALDRFAAGRNGTGGRR